MIVHDPQLPEGEYILEPEVKGKEKAQPYTEIIKPEQVSTNSSSYQELAKWQLSADKDGKLFEISLYSDTPATAQFRLTIKGTAIFADKKIQNILDIPFEDYGLTEKQTVLLEVKSDGSTTIKADGYIHGREYG